MKEKPRTEQDIINEAVKETKSLRRLDNRMIKLMKAKNLIEEEIELVKLDRDRLCGLLPNWHLRLEEKIAKALNKADNT
jgi:hypothetical protein